MLASFLDISEGGKLHKKTPTNLPFIFMSSLTSSVDISELSLGVEANQ